MKHLEKQAVQPDGISFRRWATGEKIGFTDLTDDFVDVYEEPYYVVHRAHYHAALHERAKELGVKIRLNSRVCKYDTDKVTVTLTDGKIFQGDFIVAADGTAPVALAVFVFSLPTDGVLREHRHQIHCPRYRGWRIPG